jgi:hypothetical protein
VILRHYAVVIFGSWSWVVALVEVVNGEIFVMFLGFSLSLSLSLSLWAPAAATSDVVSRAGLWSECDDDDEIFFTRLNAVEFKPRYSPSRGSVNPFISGGSLE